MLTTEPALRRPERRVLTRPWTVSDSAATQTVPAVHSDQPTQNADGSVTARGHAQMLTLYKQRMGIVTDDVGGDGGE